MNNLPVYLYQNNLDILLDLDPLTTGVNRVMYQRDLKIQRGLKSKVRIQFKNSDQKRITISNTQTFVFSMFDAINQRLIVEKELEILDDGSTTSTRGLALLTLSESDTLDLPKSSYQFVIKELDADGSFTPAYANTYYGISGTLELLNDSLPMLQPSTEISNFQISFNPGTDLYEYKSRAIQAHPEYNENNALHTASLYMTGFKGVVYIQGTLNNEASDLNKWSTIETRTYNGFSGTDYINFTGVYSYVQFLVIPAIGPTDQDNRDNQAYRGTFDKVLYRH
jgi:hypothetical protein